MKTTTTLLLALATAALAAPAFAQDTFSYTSGPYNFIDPVGTAGNVIIPASAGPTTASTYVVGATVNLSALTLTRIQTASLASHANLRIRNSSRPGLWGNVQVTTGSFSGSTLAVAAGTRTMTGPIVGSEVDAGSTWTVELADSTNNGTVGLPEVAADVLNFSFTAGTANPTTDFVHTLNIAGPVDSNGTSTTSGGASTIVTGIPGPAAPFILRSTALFSGDVAQVNTGTFFTEMRFRLTHTDLPGLSADIIPVGGTGSSAWGGATAVNKRLVTMTGTLVGATIPSTGTFEIRAYESFDDGGVASVDATWTNVTIALRQTPPPTPPAVFEDLGNLAVGTTTDTETGIGTGAVKWYRFNLTSDVSGLRFLDIDNDKSAINASFDTSMALYTNAGILRATDTFDGWNAGGMLSFGTAPAWVGRSAWSGGASFSDGRDGTLTAGTYWLAVASGDATFSPGWDVVASGTASSGDLVTNFRHLDDAAPSALPAVFTDLGTVYNTVVDTQTYGEVQTRWYRFTIPQAADNAAGTWIDIDTEDTTAYNVLTGSAGLFTNDTEIALYNSTGARLVEDDDDGSGSLSQISIGSTTSRGTLTTGANTASLARNGRDLALLPAGTYYLAVGGFNTNFATTSAYMYTASAMTGPITVNIRTPFAVPPQVLSGTITLSNSDADWSNESVSIALYQGGTQVGSTLNATLSASGAYSLTLGTPIAAGSYDVYIKGDTFLQKLVAGVNVTGSGATIDATLINGDINGDNEIGAADFSILAAAYDAVTGDPNFDAAADLNDDGEVGASDFSILAANYDGVGDAP